MSLDDLAKRLSDPSRIGLSSALAERLKLGDESTTRARLLAECADGHGHLGVYLLACYVVNDTDFWGDGEIYWWAIPALVGTDGKVETSALHGLPTGAPPHKVGSLEWMTNISLAEPPLLAVIPPGGHLASCTIRLAVYDDDGAEADVPKALAAGMEAFAEIASGSLSGPDQIITPVRQAIWKSLKADEDDILVDQDVVLRRGEVSRFGAGMLSSVVNAMARIYYFVRDEQTTEQFGPVTLHKGQSETVKFKQPMTGGGRLAIFARGADVSCSAFGDLTTDQPFINRIVDARQEGGLEHGFNVVGAGAAKFVAFYTPR